MANHDEPVHNLDDNGFTLIEILIVVVILGLLGMVVVFAIANSATRAEDSACAADANTLSTSAEAFFAQRDVRAITAADGTSDGYEKTLVNGQFLQAPSQYYDLDAAGQLVATSGSPCIA